MLAARARTRSAASGALYLLGLLLFGAALRWVLAAGACLPGASALAPAAGIAADARGRLGLSLLQVVSILAATALCAGAARALRQPQVIGEVIGGILLGPSVLGACWPAAGAFLFPPGSLGPLGLLSQVGLLLFMFLVGLELDPDALKKQARVAVLVSHASMVAPFLLGALLALRLYPGYAPAGVPFSAFALFLGVAMSVTAFPVLARIIQEKRLGRSPLGTLALSCAAVDDLTAWCALAVVTGIAQRQTLRGPLLTTGLCALYVMAMLLLARPALARWRSGRAAEAPPSRREISAVVVATLLSAFITEQIGVHALFGAFLAGVVMPKDLALRRGLNERLQDFGALILLPLFFALSGLRTQIGLLGDARAWAACGLIVLVAVSGKLGASALAARWCGRSWRESLALGALMNTRGLVELVVLNVGYDLGILSPSVFTMLVLMALATTLMTGPLLELLIPNVLRGGKSLGAAA